MTDRTVLTKHKT